uniref:Thioredoxin domain-containing protein n=1 Tax=Craspedostauros australis TaxID=1486917 RepID=A0A7R9WLB8_9STRA|mmetsp:Transcript_10564/g.29131  ORF Transcript_10564/g.29131 Transcript_10564/m.29131 type:complete len:130 (+) Transcript_10564:155-544(+)|eukprot:CAMPEP_0198135370 /NCGR_PEP_ID=MMETSP1442-20131203/60553_1 /TAXON_ID= /ORGANISM="Craspedostauros australis, Strain CCMP3328" /LENGTH=129 /DNA_ID=CAMNT_0043796535 /DNA_START=948 /DNA_END=1337 /DNA_ORIENTATION=-
MSTLLTKTAMNMTRRATRSTQRWMSVINLSDMDATTKFTDGQSKSVLYFTATWCPPCKMIKEPYEKLSDEFTEIGFGKVDVDDNSETAADYDITGVPTFILFNDGEQVGRFSGADIDKLSNSVAKLDEE